MEVVAESVAGIDVHQKQITVTLLIGDANLAKPKKVSQVRRLTRKTLSGWLSR
jgi:hypothetical protein